MNRYRKISTRMWGDEKVRALSPLQPSGQALWLYLLTGEHTTQIPGLFRIGKAALAELLGWDAIPTGIAIGELLELGLIEADWDARLVWAPNALKHNLPDSPTVIRSWGATWAELPECRLKERAFDGFCQTLENLSKPAHLKAFVDACGSTAKGTRRHPLPFKPKPFKKPLPVGMAVGTPLGPPVQEQEQEQEQLQETIVIPKEISSPKTQTELSLTIGRRTENGATLGEPESEPRTLRLIEPAPKRSELCEYLASAWKDFAHKPPAFLADYERSLRDACPGVDLLALAKSLVAWEIANPAKKKTNHVKWLQARAGVTQDESGRRPAVSHGKPPPKLAYAKAQTREEFLSEIAAESAGGEA